MDFKAFKILLAAEVVLLFIEFWLGVSINLFVSIPKLTPLNFSSYSGGSEVLAHITNGILVIALAALIVSYSIKLRSLLISALSVVALVFAVVASERGMEFALVGHNYTLSLEMAISFLIVYTLYFIEFYVVERRSMQVETEEKTPSTDCL